MKKFLILLLLSISACGGGGEKQTVNEEEIMARPKCDVQRNKIISQYGEPTKIIEEENGDVIFYYIDYFNGKENVSFGAKFHEEEDGGCYVSDVDYVEVDVR